MHLGGAQFTDGDGPGRFSIGPCSLSQAPSGPIEPLLQMQPIRCAEGVTFAATNVDTHAQRSSKRTWGGAVYPGCARSPWIMRPKAPAALRLEARL